MHKIRNMVERAQNRNSAAYNNIPARIRYNKKKIKYMHLMVFFFRIMSSICARQSFGLKIEFPKGYGGWRENVFYICDERAHPSIFYILILMLCVCVVCNVITEFCIFRAKSVREQEPRAVFVFYKYLFLTQMQLFFVVFFSFFFFV